MSLQNLSAQGLATLGNTWAMPELGWSEKISGTAQQTQPLWGQVNPNAKAETGYIRPVFGAAPYTTNNGPVAYNPKPDTQTQNPYGPAYSGPQGGGGGGSNTGGQVLGTNNYDPNAGKPNVADVTAQAQAAFQPIFDELDRRIGGIPQMRAEGEQQVQNYAKEQEANALASKTSSLNALNTTEQKQRTQATTSLRDLAAGTGQLLQSAGNIWGDSSAVPAVTSAIAKQESKNRASIMATLNDTLGEIGQKVADVENAWNLEGQKIKTWASNAMLDVAQQMRDYENSIRGQKAEMQGNMRMEALQWARDRIASIEDNARQYAQAIDTWKQQRQGALEDYQKQLQMSASYAPAATYGWDMSRMSPSQAADLANATGQSLNYGPYTVKPKTNTPWVMEGGYWVQKDENGNIVNVK